MKLVKASEKQLDAAEGVYKQVCGEDGKNGWGAPLPRDALRRDARRGCLYAVQKKGEWVAAFVLDGAQEDWFSSVEWRYGVHPAALHNLVATEAARDGLMALITDKAEALGYDSLRFCACQETESELARLLSSGAAHRAGEAVFDDIGQNYACYELPVAEACPMLPIRMRPAYRFGAMTPWGGDALATAFHKQIPDARTGEALEVSAIPGLESVTVTGETLPELLAKDGIRLAGCEAYREAFPLLLKLLAARETLSVQVHPNDVYAWAHENKLGKTEAWVILSAEPGASILYGMREGVALSDLRAALESGADIEPMIARVTVKAGDVFYMPSGMVHAIGGGILLYEIQQSSDVTYRLWDYNRMDANGKKRPLHIRQALEVIDPGLRGQRARMPERGENGLTALLQTPAFDLSCAGVNGELELASNPGAFRILTALNGLLLSWQGDAMELNAGDSAVLPAACPAVTLMGVGQALIAAPGNNERTK